MIRCRNNKKLTYLEPGGLLFADEERDRWFFVDSMLSAAYRYTGNGKISGWAVTDEGGLDIAIAVGTGIVSGAYSASDTVIHLTMTDNATNYVYFYREGSQYVDIGAADFNYYEIRGDVAASQPNYSALVATIVTAGGDIVSIVEAESIMFGGVLYDAGLAQIISHKHDGIQCELIDLETDVDGNLNYHRLPSLPSTKFTGAFGLTNLPQRSHIGLWDYPLELTKTSIFTVDYYSYNVTSAWEYGVIPLVYRNNVLVDASEYYLDYNARTIVFLEKQYVSSEISVITEYKVYSSDIDVTDRDVIINVYVNGSINTGATVDETVGVTATFTNRLNPTDKVSIVAEEYYITDEGDYYHFEIDDAISTINNRSPFRHNESVICNVLQSLMSLSRDIDISSFVKRYESGTSYLFTFGVDLYDTVFSTIPTPSAVNKEVVIGEGVVNSSTPAWNSGDEFRVSEVAGNLELDLSTCGICLVVDVSGSMLTNDPTDIRLSALQALVGDVFDVVASPLFYVVKFSNVITDVTEGWISEEADVLTAIAGCTTTEGFTNYLAAMWQAADKFQTGNTSGGTLDGKYKCIILITDGIQNTDTGYSIEDATSIMNSLDYPMKSPIYTIGLSNNVDTENLTDYAAQTSGVYSYCATAGSLTDLINFILFGDAGNRKNRLCNGYWEYDQDFSEIVTVNHIDLAGTIPSGTEVWLEVDTSEDNLTWTNVLIQQAVIGQNEINVSTRYFKVRIVLVGDGSSTPSLSSCSIDYTKAAGILFWSNVLKGNPFEIGFDLVVSDFPVGSSIDFGIWKSGDKTVANVDFVSTMTSEDYGKSIDRWLTLPDEETCSEFCVVLRFNNNTNDTMTVENWSVIWNEV